MRTKSFYFVFLALITVSNSICFSQSLVEKLGHKPTDKLLIINCDDVGMCHSANLAVIEGMETGLITSGTIMTPCPWFNEIADYAKNHPDKDFGVHLTHTAEWKYYRWGPVAPDGIVKGLLDKDGFLWKSIEEVYAHSNPEEALIEGRAQINKALNAGIKITHLDSHMGTLQYKPEYLKVYEQLALEFNLPLRMAGQATMERFGFPEYRKQTAAKGIIFPDYFIYDELDNYKDVKSFWISIIKNLKPGVTELFIHASKESEELKAIANNWKVRVQESELFTSDSDMKKIVEEEKIILTGYRQLMNLQRSGKIVTGK